jgi:1,2-diacylglycerol 3-beta-galactosyltransferase
VDPDVDRLIVGSDVAAAQARAQGVPAERITRSSGLVLHPRFHPRAGAEARARIREAEGLGPDDFVVLVLLGGKGSPELRPLTERLLAAAPDWRVVAICGDNPELFASLARAEAAAAGRLKRIGFTDRVSELMAACDVLVTKPGPGTLAEAFHLCVPTVVTRDTRIPQERYNVRLVEELGLGLAVRDWREAPAAVARLAQDSALRGDVAKKLAALPANRAVYEALEVIDSELAAREPRKTA